MAVYLSPGVFTREIDLSVLPTGIGALRPAFIGAAQKGPVNEPVLITSAQNFIDTFGNPFAESYLGYAVIAYLEEGSSCYVLRVGVQYVEGMDADLAEIAIDTSGAKVQGWGRVPVFTGIDDGIIRFRRLGDGVGDNPDPIVIHDAGVIGGPILTDAYTDAEVTDESAGAVTATVTFSSEAYSGCLDEVFTLLITGEPDLTGPIDGATYTVTDSGGDTIVSGTLGDGGTGLDNESGDITLTGLGITFSFTVTGEVGIGDTIIFNAEPDNTSMTVIVENGAVETVTIAQATYTNTAAFIAAVNLGGPADFTAVSSTDANTNTVPAIQTNTAGEWIQLTGTCACAAELGVSQWVYDIPRSFLIGADAGPYNFSTANNRVVLDVIASEETVQFDFDIPTVTGTTAVAVAAAIDANALYQGTTYFESFSLTIPGGTEHVVIVTSQARQFDQLRLQATFTFLACLRLAEELGIAFPYTLAYRSFTDSRTALPDASTVNSGLPASCDAGASTQCTADTDYYAAIVGFFVAKTAGTWIEDYTLSLEVYTEGVGDVAGRWKITINDANGITHDLIQDVSFDADDDRYVGNVLNPGTTLGGVNGNDFINWEARPSWLRPNDTTEPSPILSSGWGSASPENGIPADAEDSSALDSEVIGNPALSTGIYAFQNPESFDFNLLLTPGFASGPVIAQAIQFCENRGDVLYLVDPPFGLRPQQVIDWHNGMLTSDLASALNTSYGALYWSWLKVNDLFNGGTIWIPPSGSVAAVFARTERVTEQWFAPAGLNRGRLLSAIDIEYNPTQGERDALYGSGNAVNAIVDFTQQGITVWGQRTLQRASTALDRVNVRMLMIFLKKNLSRTLRSFVFEQNDAVTRAQVTSTIRPFLGDIAARRGLEAYNVVCDETNNTPERIDRNELWVSVFLKPTRVAEFIVLNLVVLRTGANFGAQEVLAAGGVVV